MASEFFLSVMYFTTRHEGFLVHFLFPREKNEEENSQRKEGRKMQTETLMTAVKCVS